MNRMFSVAMCVYGKDDPDYFRQAVDSILNQTLPPTEVILVVDGPIPNELEEQVVKYEKYEFFKIIRLEENMGHGNARREALKHCSNEIVALMDADDINVPCRFEKQFEVLMADKSLAIVGGNIAEFIGSVDNVVGYRNVPSTDKEIKTYLKKRCPMNQITVMFRKEMIEEAGGYLDWYCEEDYYLWLRMYLANMKFSNIPEVLVHVRVGTEMYRRRGGVKYFRSEAKLQRYMLKNKIIGIHTYVMNVVKRFVVQVVLPNRLRGWVFRSFARS